MAVVHGVSQCLLPVLVPVFAGAFCVTVLESVDFLFVAVLIPGFVSPILPIVGEVASSGDVAIWMPFLKGAMSLIFVVEGPFVYLSVFIPFGGNSILFAVQILDEIRDLTVAVRLLTPAGEGRDLIWQENQPLLLISALLKAVDFNGLIENGIK